MPANSRARRKVFLFLMLIVAVLLAAAATGGYFYWCGKRPLRPSGGLYFFSRVELPVPQFFQGDERWAGDLLGPSDDTMGATGCAITSVAMVFKYYGIDTDPQQLNWYLDGADGYTPQGWLYWERAAYLAPNKVKHVYEDLPSYYLIDTNLLRGNPVIVRLHFKNGITHFVVIAGKDGLDYLIRDPSSAGRKGIYPLKEFGSDIMALRFYQPLEPLAQGRPSL